MERIRLAAPFSEDAARSLRAGDEILLSGVIYTARDAAHRRIVDLLESGGGLPFPLQDAAIYYAGPAPARPGAVIGPAGPTTSGRMDAYTPALLRAGLRCMIGKGPRSAEVAEAMREYGAVYLAATGGCAALLARCVTDCELLAWPELGSEAVRKLTVANLPLTVALDAAGGDLYKIGPKEYLRTKPKESEMKN